MGTEETTDLDSTLNRAATSRFHVVIIALCTAVMIVDGFDTQAISFAAPGIASAWHVDHASFGFVFGIGLFGGLVGAICAGVVADRFGRKPTLLVAVLLFGAASLATPLVDSMTRWAPCGSSRVSASAVRCRAPSRSPPSTRRSGRAPPSPR